MLLPALQQSDLPVVELVSFRTLLRRLFRGAPRLAKTLRTPVDTVAKSNFEATWIPRIGERATAELRRYRWAGCTMPLTAALLGAAANFAFDGDLLYKFVGVALLAGAVGAFAIFFYRLRRFKAAVSDWFGVKVKGLPLMNPKDFDAFCQKQGLQRSDGESATGESGRHASPL